MPSVCELREKHSQSAKLCQAQWHSDLYAPPSDCVSCPQLHELLPDILDEHTLKYHWAHAFDPTQNPVGIHAHVDEAAVNFNFWVSSRFSQAVLFGSVRTSELSPGSQ